MNDIIFCKREYYVLMLMIELAQNDKSEEVKIDDVVHMRYIRHECRRYFKQGINFKQR